MQRKRSLYGTFLFVMALALSLAIAVPVCAATRYVDWYKGNDSNNGDSWATAWKNINRGDALGVVQPGDTIEVAQGIYRPTGLNGYTFTRGGTAASHITYHAYGPVVIDGGYSCYSCITLGNGSDETAYIDFDGFEITRAYNYGICANPNTNYIKIKKCVIHHIGSDYSSGVFGVWQWSSAGFRYENNVFHSFNPGAGTSAGVLIQSPGPATEVFNCTFDHTAQAGIRTQYGADAICKNNIIQYVTIKGLWNDGGNILDHLHNLFYQNASDITLTTGETVGDPIFNCSTAYDYNKHAGSPAIDSGAYVGIPYQGNKPDRGALEYHGTSMSVSNPVFLHTNTSMAWGGHTFGYLEEGERAYYWSARTYDNGGEGGPLLVGQYPKPGSGLTQTYFTFPRSAGSPRSTLPLIIRTKDGYIHVFYGEYINHDTIASNIHYWRSSVPDDISTMMDRSSLIPTTSQYRQFHARMNVGISEDGAKLVLICLVWNSDNSNANVPVIWRGSRNGADWNFTNPVSYQPSTSLFYPQVVVENNGEAIIVGQNWDTYTTSAVFTRLIHLDANNNQLFRQDLTYTSGYRCCYDIRPWNGTDWNNLQLYVGQSSENELNDHEFWKYDVVNRKLTQCAAVPTTYPYSNYGRLIQLPPRDGVMMINNPCIETMCRWYGDLFSRTHSVDTMLLSLTNPQSWSYSYGEYLFTPNPIYGSLLPKDSTFYVGSDWINPSGVGAYALFKMNANPNANYGCLDGKVLDKATLQPIAGATVTVVSGPVLTTDSNGAFWWSGAPGAYTLTVNKPGYGAQSASIAVPTEGQAARDFLLRDNNTVVVVRLTDLNDLLLHSKVEVTSAKVVTSGSTGTALGGYWWISEPDRAVGVECSSLAGVPAVVEGDRITLHGEYTNDNHGNACINVAGIDSQESGAKLVLLGMNNHAVPRADEGTFGLLVKIWGKVTFKAADNTYIYVDDGSTMSDGNADGHVGLRVVLNGLNAPASGMVYVTGVAGLDKDGSKTLRVVRPRVQSDIAP